MSGGKKSTSSSTSIPKDKTVGPFDYINSILKNKKEMIRGTENPELAEKGYNAFLTNKALSFHIDTVLYANEMNKAGHISPAMQYAYLINTVRAMNRGHSWHKKAPSEHLEAIQQYYSVNPTRAAEIYRLLGKERSESIRDRLQKGGPVK